MFERNIFGFLQYFFVCRRDGLLYNVLIFVFGTVVSLQLFIDVGISWRTMYEYFTFAVR